MKYLQVSFYTLRGIKNTIELGDFIYGEWIIYELSEPRYHINLNSHFNSDKAINRLINTGTETVESIIRKLNIKQGTNLWLNDLPFIRLKKQEQLIDLELTPFPEHWIKNII